MDSKNYANVSMSNAALVSSISGPVDTHQDFIDDEMRELNLNLLEIRPEFSTKAVSPSFLVNSTACTNIHDEIRDVRHGLRELLPRIISSPYTFLDVKILTDEYHAAAVTSDGSFVLLNLYNNHFLNLSLTIDALSVVLVYRNDSLAIIKARDVPVLYKVHIGTMKLLQKCECGVSGIGKISLSADQDFLYARAWDGKVLKIELQDLKKSSIFFEDSKMISMNTSPDNFIYIGTSDRRILKLNDHSELIISKTFKFRIDAFIYFSPTGDLILLALKYSIQVLTSTTLDVQNIIPTDVQSYSLQLTIDENFIIAGLETGELAFFSRFSKAHLKIQIHKSSISSVFTTRDTSIIYTFGTDSRLAVSHFPRLSIFKTTIDVHFPLNAILMTSKDFEKSRSEETFKPLCMALSSRKDLVIVGGESFNIAVWDRCTMRKCGELMGHLGFVYSLACVSDVVVASGGADSKIILWNFRNLRRQGTLHGHLDVVSAVVKIDNARLASGSWDKTVQIWLWELQERVFVIRDLPDRVVALCTPKFNKLMVGMSQFIHCWDLLIYCVMFEKDAESEITCFRVLECGTEQVSNVYIGLSMDEDALWFEDPFLSKTLEVWGKDESGSYQLFYYLQGIVKGEIGIHREEMDRFMIFPHKLNALHFYAYFDMPKHLAKAILAGGAMVNSACGANPLSIALELGHKECIEAIVSAAWEKRYVNPHVLSIVSVTTLDELHFLGFQSLSKIYKMLMITSVSSIRPNQVQFLPFIKASSSQFVYKKFKNGKKSEKLKIRKSLISIYIDPGSEKSIKYLYSLSLCQDLSVLKTEFIQKILLIKWKSVRFLAYLEFFVFFCHFLSLVLYCTSDSFWIMKGIALILGIILFGLELITTVSIKSFLGALCVIQGLLLIFWMVLENNSQVFNSFLIVFSALYGLNYFQIFETSYLTIRFFAGLLKKFPKIFPLFLYFTFCCFGVYFKYQITFQTLAEFQIDLIGFQEIFKILATFGVVLYFSYSLSQGRQESVSKTCYLLRIVLKYELIMVWNRKSVEKSYIQVFDKIYTQRSSGLKKIKGDVKVLNRDILEGVKEVRGKFLEVEGMINTITKSLKDVKREVNKSFSLRSGRDSTV